MAKQQLAKCVEIKSYTNPKTGEVRDLYIFVLEDDITQTQFTVGSYGGLKAVVGQKFTPLLSVAPQANISKNGNPYLKYICVVGWEKA